MYLFIYFYLFSCLTVSIAEAASSLYQFRVGDTTTLSVKTINVKNASEIQFGMVDEATREPFTDFDVAYENVPNTTIWKIKITPRKEGTSA